MNDQNWLPETGHGTSYLAVTIGLQQTHITCVNSVIKDAYSMVVLLTCYSVHVLIQLQNCNRGQYHH